MNAMEHAARNYLKVLDQSLKASEEWLPMLAEALDRIALAVHSTPPGIPVESDDRTDVSVGCLREALSRHIEAEGYYAVVVPEPNPEGGILNGERNQRR